MPKQQPWTGERAGALLSDVRSDSEPKYCVRSVFRRRTRTKQTPAAGLLRALWEATDREAVNEYDAMIATHRQASQDHLGRSSWKNRVENQLCRCRIPDGHDSHWLRTARLEAIVGLVAN